MAKTKCLNFIVPLIVYPFDIMVSIGQSDDELKKSLSKTKTKWKDVMKCEGDGRFVLNLDNTSIIRLRKYPSTPTDYGTIAHEIFHAVTFILDRVGMKLKLFSSDEAYAYLTGYITEKVYEKILKK